MPVCCDHTATARNPSLDMPTCELKPALVESLSVVPPELLQVAALPEIVAVFIWTTFGVPKFVQEAIAFEPSPESARSTLSARPPAPGILRNCAVPHDTVGGVGDVPGVIVAERE